jgi:hypothetical protein
LSFFFAFFVFASTLRGETKLLDPNPADPIAVSAEAANHWTSGSYDVWLLRGNCAIRQGTQSARGREAVLWIERANNQNRNENKVIVYLEDDVQIEGRAKTGPVKFAEPSWLARYTTTRDVQPIAQNVAGQPDVMPSIYQRGLDRRRPASADTLTRSEILPAQYEQPDNSLTPVGSSPEIINTPSPFGPTGPTVIPTPPGAPTAARAVLPDRKLRIYPRGDLGWNAQWKAENPNDPQNNRRVAIINSGVTILVDNINMNVEGIGRVDAIDVSADRAIIWTVMPDTMGGSAKDGIVQDQKLPLEIYLEGNIVFRQGDREIYANRMYYDVPNQVGTILDAELLTPMEGYQGKIRVKSDAIQQIGGGQFYAHNSFVTSSRMGGPGYRLQSGDIYFEDIQRPAYDPVTGEQLSDPATNRPVFDHKQLATSSNNFLFLGPVPVFYFPYFASDLKEQTFYIRRARAKYDNIYGTQILTNWNGYQLLGIKNKPEGTDLDFSVDYLGKRGWGGGANFSYGFEDSFFGPHEQTGGLFDFWGIHDNGLDNLGRDRSALVPDKTNRFRLFGQHREVIDGGYQITGEVGWISDRNFLESFYEREWDQLKDQSTDLELKKTFENTSLSLFGSVRLDNFFTQTEWLPRADHYWLGQSLFNDTFTWYEHTNVGFARFKPANYPTNVNDRPFAYMPWEVTPPYATSQNAATCIGQRLATRQEIDYPFQLGAVKIVPYAMGEAANWGEDLEGKTLTRLYGQGGVRANLPLWSVNPDIEDDLLNVHGIMHKINFTAEYAYSKSNQDVSLLPLYDPLDDDSIEAGRRRNRVYDYNSPPLGFPARYDERLYAIRSGLGSSVTSPSTEVLGDLSVVRLGAEQRWQTKRGAPGREHVIDWITFDTGINLYTNPNRDNFGTVPGLANYDFRWHVGDQLTLTSDGVFDFFSGGQNVYSVGAFLLRPPRGSFYVGYHHIDGPIQNRLISFSYTYQMSPKWISTMGASVDLGNQGNIGESFSITRVGESLLVNLGFSADPTRNSTGVMLSIEPRFLPHNRLSNVGGARIPPAGANGLE